ncbi:hypothetical protein BSKO_12259 [Bryopsis sp. KO-2023]|nr:hypothetical protein BSKO_12259 [Bryopsis sp. KO-2023]
MNLKTVVCGPREGWRVSNGLLKRLPRQVFSVDGPGPTTTTRKMNPPQSVRARQESSLHFPETSIVGGGLVEGPPMKDWRAPLQKQGGLSPVVALGKFDAMHVGHRALAEAAAALGGHPWLISFSGMAEVLNWEPRLPIVPFCERASVLKSWAPFCGGLPPCMRYLPFGEIRSMSPEEFVELLAEQLGAVGIVAGENYRFGYKAAGDANTLQELGGKYGMKVTILDLVTSQGEPAVENVSTSKVRDGLAKGALGQVQKYLDRRYRLVSEFDSTESIPFSGGSTIPMKAFLNQPPVEGPYPVDVQLQTISHDGLLNDVMGPLRTTISFDESGVRVPGLEMGNLAGRMHLVVDF